MPLLKDRYKTYLAPFVQSLGELLLCQFHISLVKLFADSCSYKFEGNVEG